MLGAWLAENTTAERVDVLTSLSESVEVTTPLQLESLHLSVRPDSGTAEPPFAEYDAVVAIPPLGRKKVRRTYRVPSGELELIDDPASLLVADCASQLSEVGFLAIVVPPMFGQQRSARSVRQNLRSLGLHLAALLTFDPGTFSGTSIAFELALVTREPQDGLFVASVPEDSSAQEQLAVRVWSRKEGLKPSQGRIVLERKFRGLQALEAEERYEQLTKGKGLIPVAFSKAVIDVRVPKRKGSDFEPCEELENAVYLPQMARTNATTSQQDLPARLKSYFQLLVDPEVVLPDYLAGALNAPSGQAFRQSVMTGTTIPHINKANLSESTLFLVPTPNQAQAIEASSKIQRTRNELAELEAQIWEEPRQVGRILMALDEINHEERLEEWIETLPFPLASILRSHHAQDQTDKEKYERLLHFFEALAEFVAAIHLSAFKTSQNKWPQELEALRRLMEDQRFSFERATFGLWRAISERLSKSLRSTLSKSEDWAAGLALYRTASLEPIEMLSSKRLARLLQQVNNWRNRWTGHGGAVTAAEAKERHRELRRALEEFRSLVGRKFLQYEVIEPRNAKILEGPLFKCRVRRMMGSNPQLEQSTVTLKTPAKTGSLYLHNPGHDEALELLPVVQVQDLPQPTSYFYNRTEGSKLHFVAYQFAARSEVSDVDTTLRDFFHDFDL